MKRPAFPLSTCWWIHAGGSLFCIGISLTAYLYVVRPLMGKRTLCAGRQRELSAAEQKVRELVDATVLLKERLASVRQAAAQTKVKLRPPGEVNRRVSELTALIDQCGLKTDNIRLGDTFQGDRCAILPVTLEGRGKYTQCVAFLHRLWRESPDVGVAKLAMTGHPQQAKQPGSFRFVLHWHASAIPKAIMR